MRDPKRIKPLLDLIESVWKNYPDLRLCQLLSNQFPSTNDLYYVEDDEIEKAFADKKKRDTTASQQKAAMSKIG